MGDQIPERKKFNTELTDFSESHAESTGPYAKDLDIDALIVGAGFGMSDHKAMVPSITSKR